MLPRILLIALLTQTTPPAATPPPVPVGRVSSNELPVVIIDRDNVDVHTSCRLVFPRQFIADSDGNGVVQVVGDGITVDLGGKLLRGAALGAPAEALDGTGIVVTGKRVTLKNGAVSGFRCGVLARSCDGSTFEKLDLSDNFATRLLSTTEAEDGADWLWPHENDNREWVTRYGAGLCIERSADVTVRDLKVRNTQNGLILDRVQKSRVYDNDCSFLSGWGLAMWRSSDNVVARNAFDFCIRGYSHGFYNRGQDSAGILMFEQCSRNLIALNSATHCGDGLFGFAGKESLGQKPAPDGSPADFHKRRGCNDNRIIGNDFSFAAAHGLEMTFSFGNTIALNRFEENGICGIWAGYSQDTLIAFNTFAKNGPRTDGGGEGGGINIEHGARNQIDGNDFTDESTTISLWWDDDKGLLESAWAKANGAASANNVVARNRFVRCATAIQLRETTGTIEFENVFTDTKTPLRTDAASGEPSHAAQAPIQRPSIDDVRRESNGLNTPVGARASLGGRETIRMTAFGPWSGAGPLLFLEGSSPDRARWRLLGAEKYQSAQVVGSGPLRVAAATDRTLFAVYGEEPGDVMPYVLRIGHEKGVSEGRGCIVRATWRVVFFPSACDPRADEALWREGATGADSVVIETEAIDFRFGNDGPSSLRPGGVATDVLMASKLPADGFGTIASTAVRFPKGRYTIRVLSDDGVRVKIDGKLVIDDWTWHAPRESRAEITFDAEQTVPIEIEHFELDGFAVLRFAIDGDLVRDATTKR
ncbi:MAG: right-handed parallel beta-helix repeat-containing protein [Phycisphaerae bacterium]|nr:right-handed parallel beta-helix repeat-containing protein [Phycisphaerae bacterium]